MYRVGIDVGGTFTDIYGIDDRGMLHTAKVPTSPSDLTVGLFDAIDKADIDIRHVDHLVHATTIGINTLIQRSYYGWFPRTVLVTTKGFRDVLEIRRARRECLYNPYQQKPSPLIQRRFRLTVAERMGTRGEEIEPLDKEEMTRVAKQIRRMGAETVAICFINSYANGAHEVQAREILRKHNAKTFITISSETRPKFRELGRTVTTAVRAILLPIMTDYLNALGDKLRERGFGGQLFIVKSNNGMMTAEQALLFPEESVWSGPAASAIGSLAIGRSIGHENVLTQDMGGTTWLVSIAENGSLLETTEFELEFEMPLNVPMIDVRSIGAGGGSISWVDEGGSLRVGPHSAAADPGPVCYGKGGTEPTVTDANLLLGRLDPTLGGKKRLDAELAKRAMREISSQVGLDEYETSAGIVRITCEAMASAAKLVTVDRGRDPRDFVPIVCGGAGPMHAAFVAESLRTRRVIVAANSGLTSAVGALALPIRHDVEGTFYGDTEDISVSSLNSKLETLARKSSAPLLKEGVKSDEITIERYAEMRYVGQSFEVMVSLPDGRISKSQLEEIKNRFHEAHRKEYFVSLEEFPIAFVNLRVVAHGDVGGLRLPEFPRNGKTVEEAVRERRKVFFGDDFVTTDIYDWEKLAPQHVVPGSSIIEMPNSTVVLPPNWSASIDSHKNVIMTQGE